MPYVAVDKDGSEYKYQSKPIKRWSDFEPQMNMEYMFEGSIEKLIGKKLTWEDEPVELKEKYLSCRCGKNTREDAQCLACGDVATERDEPVELKEIS